VNETFLAVGKTARTSGNWAQVRAADQVTRYLRSGAGVPVLVLDVATSAGHELDGATDVPAPDVGVWPELLTELPNHSRLILPEIPTDGPRFTSWLRGFIDGIGLAPVTLIASGPICVSAMEFTLSDPERVQRLVLVPAGQADETWLSGVVRPTTSIAYVPMLVVRRNHPVDDACAVIRRFVGGEMP